MQASPRGAKRPRPASGPPSGADDDQSLEQIFGTIDGLEKTEISSTRFVSWADRFEAPLLIAALLLLLEVALARTVLSRVPA